MPLNPGEMDREIVLEQAATAPGPSGFPVDTWSTLDTVWASKEDRDGRDRYAAAERSDPFDSVFQMYYRDDMDPEAVDLPKTRRVTFQGRTYAIVSGRILGYQEGLELLTLAGSRVTP
jgi:SPP1 family predicted phage head-tail adaptor